MGFLRQSHSVEQMSVALARDLKLNQGLHLPLVEDVGALGIKSRDRDLLQLT
jgi:hypothetical protein